MLSAPERCFFTRIGVLSPKRRLWLDNFDLPTCIYVVAGRNIEDGVCVRQGF